MKQNQFRLLLVKRAILQKKAKALLILLAITMGCSVVAALLNLQADLRSRMNRELRDYGPNVVIIPDPSAQTRYLNNSVLDAVISGPLKSRILSFTPELFLPAQVNGHPTLVVGANLHALRKLYPNWEWKVSKEPQPIIGSRLASRLGIRKDAKIKLQVSGKVTELRVGGILESGESEDDQLFMDLETAQKMSGNENRFHVIPLSVLGEIGEVENELGAFVKNHPDVSFQVIRKIAVAEMIILDKISRLMLLVISLIIITLFFCVHTTVSTILLSRQAEIALLRILGARRKQILAGLMSELMILGVLGGLLGFCLGMVMAQVLGKILFQTLIVPHFSIFLITIVSSVLMMVVSAFAPIRRAVNRQAALVLKEA